ncbi:cytochrome P450 83B1-like [Solanum tuberosum]|uniref:Cytochrome P450 n=1 Tax=Solanum tuberosum TaxID=4113 RepID=M1D465_SOLTU|nr:PREDICTED: cytochrome P450 83B1-like [Solanum tuberosum]XP_006358772.1 PREDICTED: cytochrome P450 83B1-like [Solanum tuberosum]XP_015169625.1 PREDICTED: cytochrome P450 83B1-like [Solanum tuberosum]
MMLFLLFVAFPILLIFLLPKAKRIGKNNLPPGPKGLPFIGNFHQFDSLAPHIYFWKLSKKYGKIFSLKFGSTPIIVISSAKLAKEVLKTQDLAFCSRASHLGQQKLSYNGRDIVFAPYNDSWREMRKICVLHLFSQKKVQSSSLIREDEVSRMIKKISQHVVTSQITNLSNLMILLSSSIIFKVAFGIRYDEESHESRRFYFLFEEAATMMTSFFVSDFFPSLNWIDKLTGLTNRLDKNFKELDEIYEELIKQHLNPNRPKSMEGDILDVLLQLKKEKSTPIDLTLEDIKAIVMNVLLAGSETSAAAVVWTMTALIKNPKAMKKVQEEIRKSIGNKGIVNEDDIQNMPYFKAVIKEAFRLYPSSPLLLPRETMKKSTLEGYEIQRGTIVQVNAWAIARDSEIWKNSEEFIPERFLNSNIDFKGQDFEFIPFGAGRKGCPGMALGVASVELALSNLLYSFDWELPFGMKKEDIDTDVKPGLTMHKKNDLCLIPKYYM